MDPKYKQAKTNILIGILTLAFAAFYFGVTYTFKLLEHANTVNAAFFPRICAAFAAVLGLFILYQGINGYCKLTSEEKMADKSAKKSNAAGWIRIAAVVAVLLVAAFLFKKLGFILTMPWVMFLLFVIVEKREKRRYVLYGILSVALPIAVFFVFYYVFQTLLPMGILKPFLSTYFL